MNVKSKFNKFCKSQKKGSIMIITLFFITISIAFLGFAYDVARVCILNLIQGNLASVIALSIVNECGHVYHDNVNGAKWL